jgi:hypothetical protein
MHRQCLMMMMSSVWLYEQYEPYLEQNMDKQELSTEFTTSTSSSSSLTDIIKEGGVYKNYSSVKDKLLSSKTTLFRAE